MGPAPLPPRHRAQRAPFVPALDVLGPRPKNTLGDQPGERRQRPPAASHRRPRTPRSAAERRPADVPPRAPNAHRSMRPLSSFGVHELEALW